MENTKAHQVAMHEAGHTLYAAQIGADEFIIHGKNEIRGRKVRAAIEPQFRGSCAAPGIAAIARYWTAGVVAAQVLASDPSREDEGDLEAFIGNAAAKMKVTEDLIKYWWRKAQQEVKKDLSSLEVRTLMLALATRIEAKIEEANKSSQRRVNCAVSELVEIPFLLQLLNGKS